MPTPSAAPEIIPAETNVEIIKAAIRAAVKQTGREETVLEIQVLAMADECDRLAGRNRRAAEEIARALTKYAAADDSSMGFGGNPMRATAVEDLASGHEVLKTLRQHMGCLVHAVFGAAVARSLR